MERIVNYLILLATILTSNFSYANDYKLNEIAVRIINEEYYDFVSAHLEGDHWMGPNGYCYGRS